MLGGLGSWIISLRSGEAETATGWCRLHASSLLRKLGGEKWWWKWPRWKMRSQKAGKARKARLWQLNGIWLTY